jgi:hypothetical protein
LDLDGNPLAESQAEPLTPVIRDPLQIQGGMPFGLWRLPEVGSIGLAFWDASTMRIKLWQVSEQAETEACA